MPTLYLTESEVRSLLTMDLALEAVEAAFRKISLDEATAIPRSRCQTDQVMLHVLPGAAKTLNAIGLKCYTSGKFGAQFQVFLFDSKAGGLIAILEADHLGAVRTGAASGVATKKLARKDATTVGIIGTGKQARTQLEAVCKVRAIKKARVYSRDETKRTAFAAEMSHVCGTEVIPVSTPEEAARGLDIICTATSSREPVLHGEWVAEGTHVNLIGSNFLAKTEADVELFRRASLIVSDNKDQARIEAGDFVAAMQEHVFGWADVVELAHIVAGRVPGRGSPTDVTIFKSLGLGLEDVATAAKVYQKAVAQKVGREILP
ncbi:ornithine cyclodeaminase family protein [Limnoglobus roseus]|uniref:Ornithine cyclodeaminase n=1 Tax=Limnoglobus roseus TaxID=2598579 RepID=A0A5C1ASU9_9BACT|nr:ornithine cyclodeaminase family protein [Limnoglobus roseus]QEL20334.1 ornithine cyclodeaminase [Limnoglobus roseus]